MRACTQIRTHGHKDTHTHTHILNDAKSLQQPWANVRQYSADLTAGPLYLCQWWVVSGTEPQVNSITINKTWS